MVVKASVVEAALVEVADVENSRRARWRWPCVLRNMHLDGWMDGQNLL